MTSTATPHRAFSSPSMIPTAVDLCMVDLALEMRGGSAEELGRALSAQGTTAPRIRECLDRLVHLGGGITPLLAHCRAASLLSFAAATLATSENDARRDRAVGESFLAA